MIEKVLALSTAHVDPHTVDGFGGLRSVSHEYGWLAFVYPDCPNVPEWIKPIRDKAVEEGCTAILFDRDIEAVDEFEIYNW